MKKHIALIHHLLAQASFGNQWVTRTVAQIEMMIGARLSDSLRGLNRWAWSNSGSMGRVVRAGGYQVWKVDPKNGTVTFRRRP